MSLREVSENDIMKDWIHFREEDILCYLSDEDKKHEICIDEISERILKNVPKKNQKYIRKQLDKLDKKFIIWGTNNAIMYKVTSSLLVHDRVRLGYIANRTCEFIVPEGYANDQASKVYKRDDDYFVRVPSVTVTVVLPLTRTTASARPK